MGSGAVGLNLVGGPVRGLEDRHDHAALGKPSPVLIFVFGLDLSIISVLVTLEGFGNEQGSQEGFSVGVIRISPRGKNGVFFMESAVDQ